MEEPRYCLPQRLHRLYSHGQHMRSPISPYPHYHLLYFSFLDRSQLNGVKEGEILMDRGGTGQLFRQQRPGGAVVCSGSSGPQSDVKIHVGFCLPSSPGNDRFCRVLASPHLPGTFQCCCRSSCWLRCCRTPTACREQVSQGLGDCHTGGEPVTHHNDQGL